MSLLDEIIVKREKILDILKPLNLNWIRIYGSVLARKETIWSDVDLYVSFEEHEDGLSCIHKCCEVEEKLQPLLNRRISVQCDTHIYEKFRETTQKDAIDILKLEHSKTYEITPKTSRIYYEMLRRDINTWNKFYTEYVSKKQYQVVKFNKPPRNIAGHYVSLFLDRSSWWFSRLMRLKDNDIFVQNDFDLYGLIRLSFEITDKPIDLHDCDDSMDVEFIYRCARGISKWLERKGLM